MLFNLETEEIMNNQIVFISGASSGIGEACAHIFAAHGANIIINGRNQDNLSQIKAKLESTFHINVLVLPFDVRSEEHTYELHSHSES